MTRPTTKGEFTGRHMLIIMLSFFAVVIGVNGYMAYQANKTFSGLVVENSYVESQRFNKETARRKAEIAAGNSASFHYEPGTFQVSLANISGAPLSANNVILKLGRMVENKDDQLLVLKPGAPGKFYTDLTLAGGIWQGEIIADLGNGRMIHQPIRFENKS